jgi:hypothetical protein
MNEILDYARLNCRVGTFPRGTMIGYDKALPLKIGRCVLAGNMLVFLVAEDRKFYYVRHLGRDGLDKTRWRWSALPKTRRWPVYAVREFTWPCRGISDKFRHAAAMDRIDPD